MRKFLSFFMVMIFAISIANAQFSVLLVDDDQNGLESDPIITALTNWGGSFDIDTTSSTGIPEYAELSAYDMVIWYTGNDGVDLRLWNVADTTGVGAGAAKFNDGLTEFVANGGILWIDGLDFIYDLYGSAPVDFAAGDFLYDQLGITQYLSQSHVDDGTYSDGVEQMDKVASNSLTTVDPIAWSYSTLWYSDGLAIANDATALYQMGPSGYDLAGQVTAFFRNNIVVSSMRIAKIDPQSDLDQLISEMITAAENGDFEATAMNTISSSKLSIYPNPAVNSAVINLSEINNASELRIFDITGRMIYSQNINGQKQVILNTTDFASGIYNVIISDGKNAETTKLFVVK